MPANFYYISHNCSVKQCHLFKQQDILTVNKLQLVHDCVKDMAVALKLISFVIVVLFGLLRQEFCDAYGLGGCPKYNLMKNFNITKFTGVWYEIERSFYVFEVTAGCTTIELQENLQGKIEVVARVINKWTGGETTSQGTAVISRKNPSILKYKIHTSLPNAIARLLPGAGFYQILHTDYDHFAILWTCSELFVAHTDQVWILGRHRELSVAQRAQIYRILANLHIDSERLIISKNTNCPENV